MAKSTTQVIYKPDPQATEEFLVIVNPEEFKKWKDGDTTIPLSQVVDSFQVFHSTTGHQGLLGQPSKQQLETVFETSKDDEVVKIILEKGKVQNAESIHSTFSTTNAGRGSIGVDSRGKGTHGI
ncbi:hypothetical protein HGRIS_009309 [Hohenbuehelia grisea]|uniref:Ribosome maturation protein SDO1/SBDS N-terminal domain-containing protein n=1 Tax=Hohenbuehelia grisea TaxID=104357 RepID=A0ABR3J185_9AGAR